MAVGFTNSTCTAEWCDTCGGRTGPLIGTAGCRGSFWADDVARKVGVAHNWPEYSGKALTIAIRKVLDLTRDARARDGLARYCWKSAGERWRELQAGAPGNGRGR